MSKELEALDSGEEVKTKYGVCYAYSPDVVEEFRQSLQRLEAIDNANPSEALECLEEIIHEFNEPHYELSGEYSYKNELLERCENEVNTIKQALIKESRRVVREIPNKLERWLELLSTDGINSKSMVANDIQYILKEIKKE